MGNKTFSTTGIVLKRVNVGETDRIISLLTQEFGKITCVAKGVRKMSSSKRASLELGNIVKAFCLETKSLPLLTQATLIENCSALPHSLAAFRQLSQLLEIAEKLFVESSIEVHTYKKILALRSAILSNNLGATYTRAMFRSIITDLGFQDPEESKYSTISEYIAALSDSKIHSFEYLSLKAIS